MQKRDAIIVDLGGTLAHRGERAKGDYMTRFHEDKVDETVKELVNLVNSSGTMIIILTGQRERSRAITEKWLSDNGVCYDKLMMKPDDNTLDTVDWKMYVYDNILKDCINVKYVLEDREDAVERWRNKRVRCFQTASGQDREYYVPKNVIKQKKVELSELKK